MGNKKMGNRGPLAKPPTSVGGSFISTYGHHRPFSPPIFSSSSAAPLAARVAPLERRESSPTTRRQNLTIPQLKLGVFARGSRKWKMSHSYLAPPSCAKI